MNNIPDEHLHCKYCANCECTLHSIGSAYCNADIHDYISDIESSNICGDFEYDPEFKYRT